MLLALLPLLLRAGEASSKVSYLNGEVLRLLGWEETDECLAAVDDTIARYFSSSYQPVDSLDELTGASPIVRVYKQRLITGYEFGEQAKDNGRAMKRALNEVDFDQVLAEQLLR